MQIAKFISRRFNSKGKRVLSFLVLLSLFLLVVQLFLLNHPSVANASLLSNQKGFGSGGEIEAKFGGPPKDVRITVANVLKVFLGFVGITFVVLMLLAGYKWMTAGGNEQKVEEAKSTISRAAIGLVIVLMAWSVTQYVTACVLKATGASFSVWLCPEIQ